MNKIKFLFYFAQTRWFRNFNNRKSLLDYQTKQLAKHRSYMKKSSPYYAKLPENAIFPIMDKEFMMKNFDELNTKGVQKEDVLAFALEGEKKRNFNKDYKNLAVGLSSGTSGHRGIFMTDSHEQALWAGSILGKMLPKGKLIGHKLAFFLRADNQLYQTINSSLLKLVYFDTFQPLAEHVRRLNVYQPTMLIAPASMLAALAKEIEKGTLIIKPQKVISVAEILEESDQTYLKKCFQLPVIHQIYQCTEGFLGYTCELGYLHLNEDIVHIEKYYLDQERFYPIITDFKRTSQPIINYRLNDILIEENTQCSCGSVFQRIKKIEGRSDDIFLFNGKNGVQQQVFPDFIRRCILFVHGISEYQVNQLSPSEIEIAIDKLTINQKEQLLNEFAKLAQELRFENPTITFTNYEWDQSIKLKRITRKF